jgi:hypothetical protein
MSEQPLRPSTATQILHVVTLSAFAVAQPLFDLLGNNASFFVAHRASRADVIVLALVVLLGVPAASIALRLVVSAVSDRAGWIVHVATVGLLAGVALGPPVVRLAGARWAYVLPLVFGVACAIAYVRLRGVRRFISVLTPVVLLFPALFLFGPQVRSVVFASAVAEPRGGADASSDVPVMTVLFDELSMSALIRPDGSIDATRYPNFARLAKMSTWYREATTSGLRTDQAVPAILTGNRAPTRQVPSSFAYPDNAFTLLADTHKLHVHEFVTQLCPNELCPVPGAEQTAGLASLFSDASIVYAHIVFPTAGWLPPLGDRWAGFSRDAASGAGSADPVRDWLTAAINDRETQHEGTVFERFLRDVKPSKPKPTFHWLHAQLPHPPWRYLPNGQTYPTGDSTPGYRNFKWSSDQYLADEVLQRSLLQTRFADRLLGRLLDHLTSTGQLDDMMLSVIADHGATWERNATRRDVDGPQAAGLLGVPLFVKYPGQDEGRVDTRRAELVDLVPTIADVAGVDVPFSTQGESLRARGDGHSSRRVFDGEKERVVRYSFKDARKRAAEIEALFGKGGGADDLYAFGPHRDLLGTPRGDRPEVGATFDTTPYENVDTKSGQLPVFFRATMHADVAVPVAVVVNGRIAGVGQTYVEGGKTRIALMLSPRYLEDGHNDVRVVEIA